MRSLWQGRISIVATAAATAVLLCSALASSASASVGQPSVTLTPNTGTAASTANLGVDIKFSPSGTDTAKDLTLKLPAGLIANAAIDGGACLKSATPVSACQVGSGTVTATPAGLPLVPLTLNATFDLVAPPAPGDLAGLVAQVDDPISGQLTPLGTPAAVTLRPASDPAGIGLNIAFTNVPDTFDGIQISLQEINSTFAGLRFPSSCPATPAPLTVSADSYQSSAVQTGSAPLRVTGCSSAPFAPKFNLTATRNPSDNGVALSTTVTQAANQLTAGKLALVLPAATIAPDAFSVLRYNLICANPASGTCRSIGTATAVSPLYPKPLTGSVYLTGQLLQPSVAITFPPPFPISLAGTLNLGTNTTTFTGIPDIPLTNLEVALIGGQAPAFQTTCQPASNTAKADVTSQNGDRTVSAPSRFTVAGCPPSSGQNGGGGSFTGTSTGTGTGPSAHRPSIQHATLTGLTQGRPKLRFTLAAGNGAPKLSGFTVTAPSGLRFVKHRVHGRMTLTGISVSGAKIKSASLQHGRLVVRLRRAVARLTVTIGPRALSESSALRSKARKGTLKSLRLRVTVRNTKNKTTKLSLLLKKSK